MTYGTDIFDRERWPGEIRRALADAISIGSVCNLPSKMVFCQAYGCNNRTGKKCGGKSFHRFPNPKTRPDVFKKWAAAVKVEKFLLKSYKWTPNDQICSDHFVESDYEVDLRAKLMGTKPRVVLKEDAVPSVFSFSSSSGPSTSSRDERSAQASCKEYLRTVLGERPSDQGGKGTPKTDNESNHPCTSTSDDSVLPMEGIESGGDAPNEETTQSSSQSFLPIEETVSDGDVQPKPETPQSYYHGSATGLTTGTEPTPKRRKGSRKRKRSSSKKRQKCVATSNATTQTLSSGPQPMEEKMCQCPDDFSHVRKDHTYAESYPRILKPAFVMVEVAEESQASDYGGDSSQSR
ncbi:uncharacterized protein LOC135157056 [Lytechinus pictus]|uniref:uncharacterized protein LOC135157056 n=1 Tax=Lytechinus pictus TaxID=7653 RepID=UPI0030B9EF57